MRLLQIRAVSLVSTVSIVLACSSEQPKEYLIGAAAPLSVAYGEQNQRGMSLAIDEINAAGGIHGVPLHVQVQDDRASGAEAARIAQGFVENAKIVGVVGHAGSGAMVAAARVYDAGHLVAIGTTPSSPDLTGISPWVFRMITSDSMNGATLAKFADSFRDSLERPVRAAILYQNDAYGRGLAQAFQHHFHGHIISCDPVAASITFEPHIAYFQQRKPDVVFVASDENTGIAFLREARRQHYSAIFIGGDGWQGVALDSASEGAYVGAPFSAQNPDTAVQRFVAAFTRKFARLPDAHAALAYDATQLLAKAIATAGPNRSAIRDYLAGLTPRTAFHGISGEIRFTATNDPIGDHFRLTRVHNGVLVLDNMPSAPSNTISRSMPNSLSSAGGVE